MWSWSLRGLVVSATRQSSTILPIRSALETFGLQKLYRLFALLKKGSRVIKAKLKDQPISILSAVLSDHPAALMLSEHRWNQLICCHYLVMLNQISPDDDDYLKRFPEFQTEWIYTSRLHYILCISMLSWVIFGHIMFVYVLTFSMSSCLHCHCCSFICSTSFFWPLLE